MLYFAWPMLLFALPLPWLLRSLLPAASKSESGCVFVPFTAELKALTSTAIQLTKPWNWWLLLLIWLLLILAAMRPQWLGVPITRHEVGRSLILAVDVSGSMANTDLDQSRGKRSRLDVVKQLAGEFIERRRGDRIGLIFFGTDAYLQAPLTFDRRTVREFLNQAMIGIAGRETAIGNALGLGIKQLRLAPEGKAVMILISDGSNTAGAVSPRRAADLAAGEGLRVYTIGVGSTDIALAENGKLDEALLQYIAEQTGARYFRATDKQELRQIYHQLNRLEPLTGSEETIRPARELYPWPLGLALLLSFLWVAWFSRTMEVKQ